MSDRFPPLAPPEPPRPRSRALTLPWAELGLMVLFGGILVLLA